MNNTVNIIAGLTSAIFAFVGFVRMWHSMRKEKVRPNLLTWGVWAILAVVLLKSELEAVGATWALALLLNDLLCISGTALALLFLAWRDRTKSTIGGTAQLQAVRDVNSETKL